MENNYWLVIDTLVDCLEHGVNRERLKEASFKLATEFDRRSVGNLPTDEVKRLQAVLERLNYEVFAE